MATLVKRPSGTWKAVIRRRGWPTTIKTFRTKRDAEDWARRTEDAMVRGVFINRAPSERMTFKAAVERYLAEVTPTKRASTQKAERPRAEPLLAFFGGYSLAAITPDLVAKYRDQRLATPASTPGRQGKGSGARTLSASTVRLELALLSHLFTTAIREWRLGLAQNPVANVRKPRAAAGRDRRLSAAEEARLRSAIANYSNPMLRWIFDIALETGMRSSEIAGLTLDQVDIKRRVVRLNRTKNGSARTVPLTQLATDTFAAALVNPLRPDHCRLVFFGEPGHDGHRRPYQFNKAWRTVKDSLGIKNLHFHDLRHEAVSRLVEAGLSDQEVAAISGHKSMQMLKRYTHLRAEDLVSKMDAINERRREVNRGAQE